jgi:hypothetical protein
VDQLKGKTRIVREAAPAVIETLRERGRPTREHLARTLKDEILPQFKLGSAETPAEGDLRTLEERVATLEQEVGPDNSATGSAAAGSVDEAIAQEAVVATENGEMAPAAVPDAPAPSESPFDISEAATTGTPAEPEVLPSTEESDAAVTGADTGTDIFVSEFPAADEASQNSSAAAPVTADDSDAMTADEDVEDDGNTPTGGSNPA